MLNIMKSRLVAAKAGFAGKKLILLFTTFLLLQLNTLAQEGWFWQNPLPQGNTLNDVYIFDDNSAIIVGEAGTIIQLNEDGQFNEIRHKVQGYEGDFRSVFFSTPETGWVGKSDGGLLKSENGGISWTEFYIDSSVYDIPIFDIYFIN